MSAHLPRLCYPLLRMQGRMRIPEAPLDAADVAAAAVVVGP